MKKTPRKKKEGVAMKTNVGGSVTVDKDGKVTKTKRKKAKPKDSTDTKVNENVD